MPAGRSPTSLMARATEFRQYLSLVYVGDSSTSLCTAPLSSRPQPCVLLATLSLATYLKRKLLLHLVHFRFFCLYFRRPRMASGKKPAGRYLISLLVPRDKSRPSSMPT